MGNVDPIESGAFRKTQVYIGNHIPPSPERLLTLMDQFEEWLNSDETRLLHPVRYAALAHYKLVHIHPFIDGKLLIRVGSIEFVASLNLKFRA